MHYQLWESCVWPPGCWAGRRCGAVSACSTGYHFYFWKLYLTGKGLLESITNLDHCWVNVCNCAKDTCQILGDHNRAQGKVDFDLLGQLWVCCKRRISWKKTKEQITSRYFPLGSKFSELLVSTETAGVSFVIHFSLYSGDSLIHLEAQHPWLSSLLDVAFIFPVTAKGCACLARHSVT